MNYSSIYSFNLQSLSIPLIISQIMDTEAFVSSIKVKNHDLVKLDNFDGTNFAYWQEKIIFLLTSLKVFYVLNSDSALIP